MKKLMIAAALAAMTTGAFAVCGDEPTVQSARLVYKFVYSGKTTEGKFVAGAARLCGDVDDGCYARIPATLKIEGWVALCDTTCANTIDMMAAPAAQAFWTTKPYKGDIEDAALGMDLLNVIGAKPNKAEAAGKFNGTVEFGKDATWTITDLVYAGLGSYKSSTGIYTSISGNFAGEPAASWYIGDKVCKQSDAYDCQTLALDCEKYPNTVAYGKWTMKYNASDSAKLYKGIYPKTPVYATIVEK